jgi:hypothetical protein
VPALSDADKATLLAELADLTGFSLAQCNAILTQPPGDVAEMLADLKALGALSWAAEPSTLSRVLAILNLLAAVANPISAVAGGVSGIGTAIATLKGL